MNPRQILPPDTQLPKSKKKLVIIVAAVVLLLVAAGLAYIFFIKKDAAPASTGLVAPGNAEVEPLHEPALTTEDVVSGYSNIWDMVFIDKNTVVFDERSGKLHAVKLDTKEKWEIASVPNVLAEGEGGLLGLTLDNEFATNHYMYACYNATGRTRAIKVTRFTLSEDNKSATGYTDIIKDIQSQAGRHSGCRMVMDQHSVLWVGTGDSAIGSSPQNPKSLAGKVLRVDRDGKAAEGNLGAPFDSRIYSYGHRNIQGLVLLSAALPNGAIGLTVEHGTTKDDEINWLMPGNFGWNPNGANGSYDESLPMTDKTKYPDAIDAVWSSGDPTIAPSGITFLTNTRWSQWRGWAAMAVLKDKHVHLLEINNNGSVKSEKEILKDTYGRIRSVVESPDGDLFVSTDNSNGTDKIIRVSPK